MHAYGEGVIGGFAPGVSCKNIYRLSDESNEYTGQVFDCEATCAYCALQELEKCNVTALKIVGRDRNYHTTEEVVKLYKNRIDNKNNAENVPDWWKRLYCKKKSNCKYQNTNPNYSYMIGVK